MTSTNLNFKLGVYKIHNKQLVEMEVDPILYTLVLFRALCPRVARSPALSASF